MIRIYFTDGTFVEGKIMLSLAWVYIFKTVSGSFLIVNKQKVLDNGIVKLTPPTKVKQIPHWEPELPFETGVFAQPPAYLDCLTQLQTLQEQAGTLLSELTQLSSELTQRHENNNI